MHGINEWLLILLVVLVIFGAGKLKNIGGDLGAAVKSFKEGMASPNIPILARGAGKITKKIKSFMSDIKQEFERENKFKELKDIEKEIKKNSR